MRATKYFLLSAALFCLKTAFTQDIDLTDSHVQYNTQYWIKLKAELPVSKKLDLSAQYIARIHAEDNYQPGHYLYLTGKYKFRNWLTGDLRTRLAADQGYNYYRIEGGLKVNKEFGKIKLSLRSAYFREDKTYLYSRDLAKAPVNYWRNRFEISWNLPKKFTLNNSIETWNLNNNKYAFKLDKACYISELDYQLNKHNGINLSYQNQFDIHHRKRTALNMYCIGYTYTFKKLKHGGQDHARTNS